MLDNSKERKLSRGNRDQAWRSYGGGCYRRCQRHKIGCPRFRRINGYQEIPQLVAALTRSNDACGSKRKRDLDKSKAA